MSVPPSGVTAIPFGNQTSPATSRDAPSGVTTATAPGLGSSPPMRSNPARFTKTLPRGSTTISFQPWPAAAVRLQRPVGRDDDDAVVRGQHRPAVGKPVDRERKAGHAQHDLPLPAGVEGQHLARDPVADPEPAVMPARRLTESEPGREHLGSAHGHLAWRCVHDHGDRSCAPNSSYEGGQVAGGVTRAIRASVLPSGSSEMTC